MTAGGLPELVVKGLLGDELSRLGVHIVLMQGAKRVASVADSEVLLAFTDAHVVVMLDNASGVGLAEQWPALQAMAVDQHWKAALSQLMSIEDAGGLEFEEELALAYCKQAVRSRPDRLHLHGLSEGDIIEYLRPEDFGLQETWPTLRKEYASYKSGIRRSGGMYRRPNFKKWLGDEKGVTISIAKVEAGVEKMDSIPGDLTAVLDLCKRLSTA